MATVNFGILDGFFGKVGTVVGSFWKGIPVMRAYQRRVHDRDTEQQKLIRKRFAALNKMASAFYNAITLGLQGRAEQNSVTESDVFVKENWDFLTIDVNDNVVVNYDKLQVSHGPLDNVLFEGLDLGTPLEINVNFEHCGANRHASMDDNVYIFAYNPETRTGLMSSAVKRGDGTVKLKVPAYWNGMKVHVWGFTTNTDEFNLVSSESQYIGTGSIG